MKKTILQRQSVGSPGPDGRAEQNEPGSSSQEGSPRPDGRAEQCEPGSSGQEAGKPSLSEGQTFNSFQEAEAAIQGWSRDRFHPLHVERSEKFFDSNRELQERIQYNKITYSCVHFGKKRESKSKHVRPFQHYLRMGCSMAIHLRYNQRGKLCVTKLTDEHNHPTSSELFSKYPRNRRPNAEERAEIEKFVQLKVSSSTLKSFVKQSHGKHLKLKDIHNIKQQAKKSARDGQSEGEIMLNIVKTLKEKGYTAEIETDDSGNFKMLFIQSPEMCCAFERNPDIVFVDSTYKTSKQGYVLQCFAVENEHGTVEHIAYAFLRNETQEYLADVCSLFKERNPNWQNIKMFFVDKDVTEIKVLKENFVGAKVLLCSFHVIKYWKKKIAELILTKDEKKSILSTLCSILYSNTLPKYDSNIQKLKEECPDKTFLEYFLTNWDAQREMWAHVFRKDLPTMGNNTNNRIESHFQKLKMFLQPTLSVSESLTELIRFIDRQECEKSFQDTTVARYQFLDTRGDCKMAMDLSNILTDRGFRIVAEELQKSDSQMSIEKNDTNYSVVGQGQGRQKTYTVDQDMRRCSCELSVSFGLPCAHIISCRKHENMSLDDPSLFHARWLKVDSQREVGDGNHLQTTLKPSKHGGKLSANDRFNVVRPVAMEVATLIASSGGKEYEDMFQILKQLLHSWKLNRKVALFEQLSATTNQERLDREAPHAVDEDVRMETNECIRTESGLPLINDADDVKVALKITPVKNRRGRPKTQRNITFKRKGEQRNITLKRKGSASVPTATATRPDPAVTTVAACFDARTSTLVHASSPKVSRPSPVSSPDPAVTTVAARAPSYDASTSTLVHASPPKVSRPSPVSASLIFHGSASVPTATATRPDPAVTTVAACFDARTSTLVHASSPKVSRPSPVSSPDPAVTTVAARAPSYDASTSTLVHASPPKVSRPSPVSASLIFHGSASVPTATATRPDPAVTTVAACYDARTSTLVHASSPKVSRPSPVSSPDPAVTTVAARAPSLLVSNESPPLPYAGFKAGGIILHEEDLQTLLPGAWLNDNVIHAYLGVLAQESTNSVYVINCYTVHYWNKAEYTHWSFEKVHFEDYNWILLPVCSHAHWFLVAGHVGSRQVYIMDSLPSASRQRTFFSHWRKFMKERGAVTGECLDGWTLETIPVAKQQDGSSCGLFVLMNAEALLTDGDPTTLDKLCMESLRGYIRTRLIGAQK